MLVAGFFLKSFKQRLIVFTAFVLLFSAPLRARVLVMDDFNDNASGNLFGGADGDLNGGTAPSISNSAAIGNVGFSEQVPFDAGAQTFDGFKTNRNNVSLSSFKYVSFWIRGQSGGEKLYCLVDDGAAFPKARIFTFLPDQVTTDFQKVVISTKAFFGSSLNWGANTGDFKIEANQDIPSGAGTVFIDDIRFGDKPAPVWWDNFNDGAQPFNYGLDYETFISPSGSILTPVYDSSVRYGSTGFSYRIDFGRNASTNEALILLPSSNEGVDLTGTDTLSFQIRSDAAGSGNNLGIGVKDTAGAESVVSLTTYLSGGLSTTFREVRITTTAFSSVNMSKLRSVEVWFQKSASPLVTQTSTFSIYLDNLQFIDASTPTAPSNFVSNNLAVGNGSVFTTTNTISLVAGSTATDPGLEEVGLEYSTDGNTWYRIATATDTSSTAYSFTWYTSALSVGNNYRIRAYAQDVQGNRGFLGPYTGISVLRTTATFTQSGFLSGTVTLPDGIVADGETSITVPEGALTAPVDLSLTNVVPSQAPAGQFRGILPASAVLFRPEGLKFQKAAQITLKFSDVSPRDGFVDGTQTSVSQLRMFWFDGIEWRPVAGRINTTANTITGPVFHFSYYALFPVTQDPLESRPKERIITPNGDGINDFVFFDNLPADVSIQIYDLSGRRVRTLQGIGYWDGRADGGEFVPNGAYLYQYRANLQDVTGAVGVAR
jgi:flagellar hook assembly protein FlgD